MFDIIFREDQPQKAVPGGSTFNAMISLGRVFQHIPEGVRPSVAMVTETGDDHIGEVITNFMRDNHVSTDLVTVNTGTQSHLSLAFLDNESNAQYEFYKDHAAARLDAAKASVAFTSQDLVLFGSFFAINPVLRDYTRPLFSAAHDAGAILYYDINFRKSHVKDIPQVMQNLEENMRFATVVRGSAEDFGYLYGTTDAREVYDRHIRQHCPHFICTDGAHETHLFVPNIDNPGSFIQICIPSEVLQKVVSTIGAGDNFNAGFIYALIRDDIKSSDLSLLTVSKWMKLVECGQRFASHVCQRIDNYVEIGWI